MTFVKLWNKWYEWPNRNELRFYNRRHGFISIVDEKVPEWSNVIIMEYEDWHDLYEHEHFSWMLADIRDHELWIDQDGNYWGGDCHEVDAEYILEDIFGIDIDLMAAGDALVKAGWIKAQTSLMTQYYVENGMYDNLTTAQYISLANYCEEHGIPLSFYGLSEDY